MHQQYQQAELKAAVCQAAGMEGGDGKAALEKLGATPEGQAKLRAVMKKAMPKYGTFAEQLLNSELAVLGKRMDAVGRGPCTAAAACSTGRQLLDITEI
jgi:hypothetical protein